VSAPDEIRQVLREPHDEARARRNWDAIARRRHRTPSIGSSRPVIALALGLGLMTAGALAMFGLPHAPGPLALEDGTRAHGTIDRRSITLDDGSRISLDEGTRLEILENTGDHVRLWLHEGVAHFDVVPGGPRRWAIETGLVTVEVLGTAFSVARTALEVRVAVERGSVLVRGPTAPDGMRRLAAGESLTLPAGEPSLTASPATQSDPAPAQAQAPEATRTRPIEVHEAAETLEPEAIATEQAPMAPRMRDVDALRAEGRIDDAIALLETIGNDPSAGRERPLAAFTRGRLELDRRDRPMEAAAAFAQAIELGLREPLLEDAQARRVEAFARASDVAAAREAADVYRHEHPEGRWSAEVERWSPAP